MPRKISIAAPHLAYILSLLQDGMEWSKIEQGDLVKLYHGDRDVYEWENGGQSLTDKVASYLNPFMRYVYSTINDYMQSYVPTWQEAIKEMQEVEYWRWNSCPKNAHREFNISNIGYVENWLDWDKYLEACIDGEYLSFSERDSIITKHDTGGY